jgi:hypothetical protein
MRRPRLTALVLAFAAGLLCLHPFAPRQSARAAQPEEFRSIDGLGNNPTDPSRGSAGMRLLRLGAAAYGDEVSSMAGAERPSPRAISNLLVAQPRMLPNARGATSYLWQWGQFLDHDIDLTGAAVPAEPAPIPVPLDDPIFPPGGFIGFNRSLHDPASGSGPGNPRQQINEITAFIDGSNVYGSDPVRATFLRMGDESGRLKLSAGGLLPFNTAGLPNAGGPSASLFLAGDVRANEQLGLTAMHTLFAREHNRMADAIRAAHPGLSGDAVYERARAWVGALIQAVTYREFIPLILGPDALPPYAGYRPEVDPGIENFFSTAGFRVGHTMIPPELLRLGPNMQPIAEGNLPLREAFFRPDRLIAEGGIDPLLRGLAAQPAQEIDVFVVDDLRNFLFGPPGAGGFDLPSLNIQRGRDHGLPAYNQARLDYGLAPKASFEEISSDPEVRRRLLAAYGSVDRMDAWAGILAEDHAPGAMVGELARAVMIDQFRRLRDGDRFWYQRAFSGAELAEIDSTRLKDVIMRNTEIREAQLPARVFLLDPEPRVDPNSQLACQVHLPILRFLGQDEVCSAWIAVQYLGCDPAKAVLVAWGEPGFCPPQAAGPLKVECTGLLQPGSSWQLQGAQIPTGAKGGILFKFTARQLGELPGNPGPTLADDLGFDDVAADLMCETLFFGVVGDSDDYRRFKKAYNEGLVFAGIPQATVAGGGALAVEVLRHCPGDQTPQSTVSSKYNGIAGSHLGAADPTFGGFGYYAPLVQADKAGMNSLLYIQNGGLECSSVEIWFKSQDDCLRARICEIFSLAPGETYQFDAADCVGPDWQGSAWLRASQPLGIVVDLVGRDLLMSYIGEPAPFDYLQEPEDDPETLRAVTGEQVAFGPLVYSEFQGWDTGLQVMNLSPLSNAKVKVYFLDRSGDIVTTLVDWICPRGSQTFFLPLVAGLPGGWVGSVRVESQIWWTPGAEAVAAPDLAGVVTLVKYLDVARAATAEALAYNLLPEHKSYIWQVGAGPGGLQSGVGLIALPSLQKDLDGTGLTSELAIMNLVAKPGFTDFAIYIYDQNGLLDFVCQKLHDRQVEYIDLQTWGYVSGGFKGSAIVSASFWEHEVFDGAGNFVRNLVGLGAVSVERSGTRLGQDVPGDEAAGSRGIPFARSESEGLAFCFLGFPPLCTGQP